MKNRFKLNIHNNIYLYGLIILLCIMLSFVLSYVIDDADYIGHTTLYNGITNVVEIKVVTSDKDVTENIIKNVTNEGISQVHNELNVEINPSTTIRKKIDLSKIIVRGLIAGLAICFVVFSVVFSPKSTVKDEDDINEIFGDVPILAKIPKNYIKEGQDNNEK